MLIKPRFLEGNCMHIYTDGACRGNPGPGGWAAILVNESGEETELFGAEAHTTNNRMEMLAAIRGLEALATAAQSITVVTDSNYLKQGMTAWIHGWKRKHWKNAQGKPVANQDLWMMLDALSQQHTIAWQWVKGHSGHEYNERCDALANRAIDER